MRVDIAVPAFGYKNHVGIHRRHGLIRTWLTTEAARHDGAQLPKLVSKGNTGSDVWADISYCTKANEQHLAENGRRSQEAGLKVRRVLLTSLPALCSISDCRPRSGPPRPPSLILSNSCDHCGAEHFLTHTAPLDQACRLIRERSAPLSTGAAGLGLLVRRAWLNHASSIDERGHTPPAAVRCPSRRPLRTPGAGNAETPSLLRSFVSFFLSSPVPSFTRSFLHSFLPSPVPSFTRSFFHPFLPSLVPSFLHSFLPSSLCLLEVT
jgi:hypothetical protein